MQENEDFERSEIKNCDLLVIITSRLHDVITKTKLLTGIIRQDPMPSCCELFVVKIGSF